MTTTADSSTGRLNKYARVIGVLKTFRNRKYINTSRMKTIQDPNEIFFHLAEALAVQLALDQKRVMTFCIRSLSLTNI